MATNSRAEHLSLDFILVEAEAGENSFMIDQRISSPGTDRCRKLLWAKENEGVGVSGS